LVKHYFINEYPVTTQLTAADYETIALRHLDEIFLTHNTAIVCGGTGLYIKALCEGLDEMPGINEAVYGSVNEQYRQQGIGWLQDAIREEDETFYKKGEMQNPARMLRALIFKRSTGESITHYQSGKKKERSFRIIKVGLELPRETLYARINARVDVMMQQGLLAEVQQLFPQRHLKNLQTVGYTELFNFLEGRTTLETAVQLIKQNTRHYAKRQMTWFKKDKEMLWFSADSANVVEQVTGVVNFKY
jgi:tRNA dimethylallyltransferase